MINSLSQFCNPVTVDLLGHGKTEKPGNADRFSLTCQLQDLHQIICELPASSLFLHGYSMGGRLALRFALKHAGLLKGLILESTNFGLPTKKRKNDRKKIDEKRARHIETDFHDFLDKWQQMPLFNSGVEIPVELSQQYRQIQVAQAPDAMANSLRGFGTAKMPVRA
ncbi:MAG: alpha/beta fold hydrolase [Balneolaceae bacterium]|nr:alpha/beta fold hydrolase [Balneolaceae bacterium]